jgi:hypothetical protein
LNSLDFRKERSRVWRRKIGFKLRIKDKRNWAWSKTKIISRGKGTKIKGFSIKKILKLKNSNHLKKTNWYKYRWRR